MQILKFDQLASTNNHAKALIQEGKAKDGQIIYAVEQTAGRGQNTGTWESEAGKNLTFSLIIEPQNIEPKNQFIISQAVSVGIMKYLRFLVDDELIHIKWPNDIYVGMKKIAGILIEHSIQGNQILYSVIGVGLNVNQTEFSENVANPTSLSLLTKEEYDIETELDEITTSIALTLEFLQLDDGRDTRIEYLNHLLFLDEEREYEVRGEKIIGKIIGVNGYGLLQIQTKNGVILECDLKEVVYLF
jgi:BirA family biotin operon repressor/biotin-[acetyl-CoA-carboxylase] ligase